MEKEKLNYTIQCKDCKEIIPINSENIKNTKVRTKDGTIELLYIDCPKCGSRHFVQVDNDASLRIKKQCLKTFVKLSKRKINYERVPKKDAEAFDNLRVRLSDLRATLMAEYEGSDVTDTRTGETYQLHFTMC